MRILLWLSDIQAQPQSQATRDRYTLCRGSCDMHIYRGSGDFKIPKLGALKGIRTIATQNLVSHDHDHKHF